jgi:hypothetical protein
MTRVAVLSEDRRNVAREIDLTVCGRGKRRMTRKRRPQSRNENDVERDSQEASFTTSATK